MKKAKTLIFINGLLWFKTIILIVEIITENFMVPLKLGRRNIGEENA